MNRPDFDVPEEYDHLLEEALSVSGESKEFFARGRVEAMRETFAKHDAKTDLVLDFGCGIGDTTPILLEMLGASRVVGVDPSVKSVEFGRSRLSDRGIELFTAVPAASVGAFDACYVNGVFHHIDASAQPGAAAKIFRALRPGGRVCLWENHAGHPGTRFIMARCAFDDDAIPLWPRQVRRLLEQAGFVIEETLYRFLFPRALAFLRPLERGLLRLPVGAQYAVLARKP